MNFEFASALGAAIAKNIVRPPAFEITAAPHAHSLDVRKFQGAIDPAAATPSWRANIPIRMIIERNDDDGLRDSPNPKRAQIMKIARAIKDKRRKARFKLAVKLID
jgi:hypothetical protein